MKGYLEVENHNIEFYDRDGIYVAHCLSDGEEVVSVVKNSRALAHAVLLLKLATHLHSATKMRDARGANVRK